MEHVWLVNRKYKFLACIIAALFHFVPQTASADTSTESKHTPMKVIGGYEVDTGGTPFAIIRTSLASCSGTLVGPRHVLTAAHCIAAFKAEETSVYLGNEWIPAAETWYHAFYDDSPTNVTDENQRYDLGMIILSADPKVTQILPIIAEPITKSKTKFQTVGFGRTEYGTLEKPYEAVLTVGSVEDGLFTSYDFVDQAGICSGDSGAPALMTVSKDKKYQGVGGFVSFGNRFEDGERCFPGGDTYNVFVNTQSVYAQDFFANWPEIRMLYPSKYRILAKARTAYAGVEEAQSAKKMQPAIKSLKKALKSILAAEQSASGRLKKLVLNAEESVNRSIRAKSLRDAKRNLSKIKLQLDKVMTASYPYNY